MVGIVSRVIEKSRVRLEESANEMAFNSDVELIERSPASTASPENRHPHKGLLIRIGRERPNFSHAVTCDARRGVVQSARQAVGVMKMRHDKSHRSGPNGGIHRNPSPRKASSEMIPPAFAANFECRHDSESRRMW